MNLKNNPQKLIVAAALFEQIDRRIFWSVKIGKFYRVLGKQKLNSMVNYPENILPLD